MATSQTNQEKIRAIHDKLVKAKSSPVEYSARELWDLLDDHEKDLFLTYFQDKSINEFLAESQDDIALEVKAAEDAEVDAQTVEDITAGRTDAALMAYWMAERENDAQIREEISRRLNGDIKKVDYVMLALNNRRRQLAVEKYRETLNPQQTIVLEQTVEAVNPKRSGYTDATTQGATSLTDAYVTVDKITDATIDRLVRKNGLGSLSQAQRSKVDAAVRVALASGGCRLDYIPGVVMVVTQAVQDVKTTWNAPGDIRKLDQIIIDSTQVETRDTPSKPTSTTEFRPATGEVLTEGGFEQPTQRTQTNNEPIYSYALGTAVVTAALDQQLQKQLNESIQKFTELSQDVEKAVTEPQNGQLPILEKDKAQTIQNNLNKIHVAISQNPQVAVLAQSIVPEPPVKELEAALKEAGIVISPDNPKAKYLAGIVKGADIQGAVSAPAMFIMSRLTPEQRIKAEEHIQTHPNSALAKYHNQYSQVFQQVHFWQDKLAGREIAPVLQTGLNNIPMVGQVFRFPQVIQGRLAEFAGKALGKEMVAKVATNEIVKTLAEKGLQGLAQKAVTFGAQKLGMAVLGDAALAATGIGAPIAAIMAAVQVAKAAWDLVKGFLPAGLGDIKAREVATAPLLLGGMLAGAIPMAIGSGAAIASSVMTTIVASAAVGVLLYLTSFTMAPILSTMVHFGSGFGVLGGGLSTYTGPITSGCSGQWPISHGSIIQGPHGWFSHARIEAVDMTAAVGTPLFSITSGTVKFAGWGDVYGNLIEISTKSPDGSAYDVWYGHLSSIQVSTGQTISLGQQIGLTGMTSSNPDYQNPHLHLEYRGIKYNSCPAGGTQVPDGCYLSTCGSIRW